MIKNVHGNTVDHLGEAIVAGRYAPGASIPPEPLLCEELGVSRTVVRESVKSLIAKGLVTSGPKVGTRVLPSDAWNWFDFTLKKDKSKQTEHAVAYYVIGDAADPKAPGNVWRTAQTWPPVEAAETKYFLQHDRELSRMVPSGTEPLTYTYDPANPVPTIGGIQLSLPAGPMAGPPSSPAAARRRRGARSPRWPPATRP